MVALTFWCGDFSRMEFEWKKGAKAQRFSVAVCIGFPLCVEEGEQK